MKIELNATNYYNEWWPGKKTLYTAQFQHQNVTNTEAFGIVVSGKHKPAQSDSTVKGVRFDDCTMTFIPPGIREQYPNMEIFLVFNARITRLTKTDLEQFRGIRELWFSNCQVEHLPGNLLEHLPELEIVSFQSCGIKYIDPEILDRLPHLKVAKFNSNANIDCYHDSLSTLSGENSVSLERLKEILRTGASKTPADFVTEVSLPRTIAMDIRDMLASEEFKDVTVVVGDVDFRAHKFMLAARSRVFATRIASDPRTETLEVVGVKADVFEKLLRFIYEDEMPAIEEERSYEMFKASRHLGLEKISLEAMKLMPKGVNKENAVEMLECGVKYANEELKASAFAEIRKMFPDRELKDELAEDTEKVAKIVDAKKKMDEAIEKAIAEFNNLGFFE